MVKNAKVEIIESEILTPGQKEEIVNLWNNEYPKGLSLAGVAAFNEYLETLSDKHYIMIIEQGRIMGWLIHFIRDGGRCFAMLLDSDFQGRGMGSTLLNKAKECNSELIGWVIDTNGHIKNDGTFYKSPIGFYEKAGFEILSDVVTQKNGINGVRVRWQTRTRT